MLHPGSTLWGAEAIGALIAAARMYEDEGLALFAGELVVRRGLVAYECVAARHQPSLLFPDKLTIHGGSWAFCAFDAHAGGHQWRETGGAAFGDLLRKAGIALAEEDERRALARQHRR